jgi:hypothetical protein
MRLFIAVLLPVGSWLQAEARWTCVSRSGEGDKIKQIRQARPVQWYTKNLPSFDSEIKWRAEHEDGWSGFAVTSVSVFGPGKAGRIECRSMAR